MALLAGDTFADVKIWVLASGCLCDFELITGALVLKVRMGEPWQGRLWRPQPGARLVTRRAGCILGFAPAAA